MSSKGMPRYVPGHVPDFGPWSDAGDVESDVEVAEEVMSIAGIVGEDLDIKKLSSPEDFSEEVEQFSTQIAAEIAALRASIETRSKGGGTSPELMARLDEIVGKMEDATNELTTVLAQMRTGSEGDGSEDDVSSPSLPEKTFRRS